MGSLGRGPPLPGSSPRVVIGTLLRSRPRRTDLIKRLIAGDHAKLAVRSLFERLHAVLQVVNFCRELPIALAKPVVFGSLCRDRSLEAMQFADTVFGKPYPALQKHHDDNQGCAEPFHKWMVSNAMPPAKRERLDCGYEFATNLGVRCTDWHHLCRRPTAAAPDANAYS